MSSRDPSRQVWDSLATEYGSNAPLKAVVGSTSLGNEYFDRSTKRALSKLALGCDDVVLDFGCGVGRLSLWLAPRVRTVLGVDTSPEMVNAASRRAQSEGIRNVFFTKLEDDVLPLEGGTSSVVVCSGVLQYLMTDNELSRVAGELGRVLKPDGRLALIEQFADDGPVRLSGAQDLAGGCLLRSLSQHETMFAEHGLVLGDSYPVYRKRVVARLERLERAIEVPGWVSKRARALAISLDLQLEDRFPTRGRSPRGFRLAVFEKGGT